MNPSKQLPDLDISSAYNTDAEFDRFDDHLRQHGMLGPDYLYTGINGETLENVLAHGIHDARKKVTFCFRQGELEDARATSSDDHPLKYALDHASPAIVVYRADHLKEGAPHKFTLEMGKDFRDALVAVFRVKTDAPVTVPEDDEW